MSADEVKLAVIATKLDNLNENLKTVDKKVDNMDGKLSQHYVTKEEFEPIKKGFYALVGMLVLAILGAVVNQVVHP